MRRDLDAVVAGLTLEYNSGAVEGTVNRIKQLKTAMCGRAKPGLPRMRILLAEHLQLNPGKQDRPGETGYLTTGSAI